MPPDGACILTVLKPLQSLTGGSRFDALQYRRLTNRRANNTIQLRATTSAYIRRYLYLRIRIYAISYTSHFPNKIFVGLIPAASASRRDRSINVSPTTQVTERKTTILFFLETSESTKNRRRGLLAEISHKETADTEKRTA